MVSTSPVIDAFHSLTTPLHSVYIIVCAIFSVYIGWAKKGEKERSAAKRKEKRKKLRRLL